MNFLFDRLGLGIRTKILLWVLTVFVVIYGATLTYVYENTRDDLLRAAVQEALSTTQIIAVTLFRNYEIEHDSRQIQSYILGAMKYKSSLIEINVVNRNLDIVSSSDDGKIDEAVTEQCYIDALNNERSVFLLDDRPEPIVRIVYPVSAGSSEGQFATGGVELRSSLSDQFTYLAAIRENTILAGLAILAGMLTVILLISNSITRPIHNLYRGMEKVDDGDLDVKVPVVSTDEIGYLTGTFNHMIDSVRISNQKILSMVESSRRFVPEEFLNALGRDDITFVSLGDATLRHMTVLFMDIRSFTDMSEQMSAEENLEFLNTLLQSLLPAIEEHEGFIDKYMGDAVMALFPDRPDNAFRAALGMREGLRSYNVARRSRGEPVVDIGVGINSGELILGTLGSTARIDTTVIGSTVNVASRLESLTKEYGIPIIIPQAVYYSMQSQTKALAPATDLGPVRIRGVSGEMILMGVPDPAGGV